MRSRPGFRRNESRSSRVFPLSAIALLGCFALYASNLESGRRRPRPVATTPEAAPDDARIPTVPPMPPSPLAAAAAPPPRPDPDDAETARIQNYLDSLYKRTDVASSFRTKYGEDIDCIDFYAQASVKSEIAHGNAIRIPDFSGAPARAVPRKPTGNPDGADPLDEVAFNGQPDENGNPRKCSGMTVPVVRASVAQIKSAGGLDRYLMRQRQPVAPPLTPPPGAPPSDRAGYMHVTGNYDSTKGGIGPIFGGQAIGSVWKPGTSDGVNLAGGHSLAQTWTTSATSGPCDQRGGANCVQTIELGWMVAPGQYQSCITTPCTPDWNPHLFIFSTQDGYWSTGCYDGLPCNNPPACSFGSQPCTSYPNNLEPNPFMGMPGAAYAPGQALPSSAGGVIVELNLFTENFNGQWFVSANGSAIGFWPASTWDGSFYNINGHRPPGLTITQGQPLGQHPTAKGSTPNSAALYEVGGEVATPFQAFNLDSPSGDEINMGSGIGSQEGYSAAAYFRNIELLTGYLYLGVASADIDNQPFANFYASDLNCYTYGWGYNGTPQKISLTPASLGYTLLQYPTARSSSVTSPPQGPGGGGRTGNWGTYLYYGGLGWYSGFPFTPLDPNGGTNDFCCSTKAQNGVGDDTQCLQGGG